MFPFSVFLLSVLHFIQGRKFLQRQQFFGLFPGNSFSFQKAPAVFVKNDG
jgi:hypothetical protein